MTRISKGTLRNASGAIFAPMCFDSNTDMWKHITLREETFKFAIWNYRICCLPGNVWASAGKKEIPFTGISNISHCHVPRGKLFGSGQVFPEMDVWEGWRMTSERISKLWGIAKAAKWHLLTYFSQAWVLKTRQIKKKTQKFRKSHKIQKMKTIPKISLKIGPCRPRKLGPLFSHEKTTFKWSIVFSEAVFSTN